MQSAAPGFRNAAANDYTLATNSVCISAGSAFVYGLPGKEYYRDETITRMWRVRAGEGDIGTFESTTTNSSVGPYDAVPLPRLSIVPSGANAVVSWPLFAGDFQLDQSDFNNAISWGQVTSRYVTNATNIAAGVSFDCGNDVVVAPSCVGVDSFMNDRLHRSRCARKRTGVCSSKHSCRATSEGFESHA